MKISKFFLSTLIAASAMTATAYAETPSTTSIDSIVAGKTVENTRPTSSYVLWVGGETGGEMSEATNWKEGTINGTEIMWGTENGTPNSAATGQNGSLMVVGAGYKDANIVIAGSVNTSDGGGIIVSGASNVVSVGLGTWAGSIQVDAGNTLNTTWSHLKEGAIVANGIVNVTSGNLNLDGAGERQWWVGVAGSINFSAATGLSTGTVKLSGEIDNNKEGASLDGLINRRLGISVESKELVSFEKGLSSGLDSISVGEIRATSGETLTKVASVDSLANQNQYYAEKTSSGVKVYYTVEGQIVKESLTWAGTDSNSIWSEKGSNWSSSGTTTSFFNGDDVIFDSSATKTVTLNNGESVSVGTATIKSGTDYTWRTDSGTSTVKGLELVVESGATLKVGDSDSKVVDLAFDKVSVSGTLNYYNGADAWSELALTGGTLKFGDLPSGSGLSISKTSVSGTTTITADWDGKVSLGVVSGSGSLAISGPTSGSALDVTIGGLSGYSGSLSLTANKGLSVTLDGTGVPDVSSSTKELGNENLEIALGESVSLHLANAMSKFTYKALTMKNGSMLTFNNGNTWGGEDSRDISGKLEVDATGGRVTIKGGTNGNTSNIAGEITGVGTVSFEQINGGGNNYSVSANITDKSATEKLSVNVGLSASLTLSGDNTYSGGTTLTSGTLVVAHKNALGTGKLSATGGILKLNADADFAIEGTVALDRFDASETNPTSIAIDFGSDGMITTSASSTEWGGGINFGTGVKTKLDGGAANVTFTIALTQEQMDSYLANGTLNVERVLLSATNSYNGLKAGADGIWNLNETQVLKIIVENTTGGVLASSTGTLLSAGNWSWENDGLSNVGFNVTMDAGAGTDTATLTLTIPEPSAFGLLAGVGALALVASRRRRSRR